MRAVTLPSLDTPHDLDRDAITSLREKGHCVVRGLATAAECAAYLPEIQAGVDRWHPEPSPLDERGTSEAWLGEFLAHQRSRAVIATKFGGATDPKDPNSGGNHRKCLVQSLDASLRRLGTHYVDLLLLHSECSRHVPLCTAPCANTCKRNTC